MYSVLFVSLFLISSVLFCVLLYFPSQIILCYLFETVCLYSSFSMCYLLYIVFLQSLELYFHPLKVVSRYRDPQLQVGENYSYFCSVWDQSFSYPMSYFVVQCAVRYDIVGEGHAPLFFKINSTSGVIVLAEDLETRDKGIEYKVWGLRILARIYYK